MSTAQRRVSFLETVFAASAAMTMAIFNRPSEEVLRERLMEIFGESEIPEPVASQVVEELISKYRNNVYGEVAAGVDPGTPNGDFPASIEISGPLEITEINEAALQELLNDVEIEAVVVSDPYAITAENIAAAESSPYISADHPNIDALVRFATVAVHLLSNGRSPRQADAHIRNALADSINYLGYLAHRNAHEKGFWPQGGRNKGEMISLMHSELSEMLEAVRDDQKAIAEGGVVRESEKIPGFSLEEEEAADLFIRLADYCFAHELRLGEAIAAKMQFNASRPWKHGRAF